MVGLDGLVNVVHVDADGNTHQHVLGALDHLAMEPQQVGALKRLMRMQAANMTGQGSISMVKSHQALFPSSAQTAAAHIMC